MDGSKMGCNGLLKHQTRTVMDGAVFLTQVMDNNKLINSKAPSVKFVSRKQKVFFIVE